MSEAATNTGQNGDIVRLIYRSHSTIPTGQQESELGNILRSARKNNAAVGVTGALLYYDGWFAQALEGPNEAVHTIFNRIKSDGRHNTIEIKTDTPVASRVFAKWAMANVGEHGEADIPMVPTSDGVTAGASWRATEEQEEILTILRDSSRGYGRGA